MTTPNTDLRDRIARALYDDERGPGAWEADQDDCCARWEIDAAKSTADALMPLIREAQGEAWDEGHSWGWSDAQDAHDVRQAMDRADWPLNTPNPYRQETDR